MFRTLSTLLGRLSVGRKLLLIYLLDLTAVIFISGILINEKFIAIDFARKELAGNAYIKALRPSLLDVGGAWPAGMAPLAPPSPFDVERIEAAHGAGMESRQLAQAYAAKLEGLQSLRATNAVITSAERQRLQQEALDRGRDLVTRVGNQSNLILDPDLDSYYTMSLVLLRYPELLEIVSRISGHMHTLEGLPDRRTNTEARTRYFILEGRLDATAKGIESDQNEAFAAAADGQLRTALEPAQARVLQAIERFRQATHATLEGGGSLGMNEVERSQRELVSSIGLAWGQAGVELDRLVETRIHGFFVRMWLHLGTALFLLLLILSAVFYVARQIARPLQRLSAVTDEVRRTGDHSLRAEWHSGDEIGRLVLGFNDMLAQLDRERSIQQELAASARAAQAQKNLLEALPIPMVVTAVPGHEVLHANGPAQQWLGERRTDPWVVGLEPGVRVRFFQQLADREVVDEFEVRWRAGTEPTWAVLSARRLQYQGQDAVLTAFTPINHLKQMEQRLELWAKVFEASSEGILIIDGEHRVLTGNHAFCRNTAYDLAEVVGRVPDFLIAGDGGERFFTELWPTLDKRGSWQGEVRLRRRNDTEFPAWLVINAVRAGPGRISHYIFTSLDISDRKASEERIHFLAHHDVLTGLPNRTLCIERLRLAMQQAQRSGQKVGVLFIDLDRFKTINDSLGHHVGDGLLRSVAMRLLEAVRTGDTVCRLGGDEFIVVLNGAHDSNEILGIVERRLIPLIRRPHVIDGAELHVSCSVGMAIYPDDASDIDEVLRHADVAMYQAKAMGRDSAQFFTPELNERAHKRLRLESQLRRAIERDELSLHYQPRIAARSGAVVGVEALLRWHSAELGHVPPAEFIPIAEESRQIVAIGAWVIGEACRQHAVWREQGRGEVAVSINLSALQLHDPGLIGVLEAAIQRHGVRPGALELELTESTLMNVEHTLPHLQRLRALGVQLSVDDFGTGYSSLNYLHRFPIDRLKIDRSFVGDMLDDPANLAIIRAIIGLGHTLGLQVVAEGVESEEVATALLGAHCDELQGYHFARPLPAQALGEWLDARSDVRVRG